MTFIRILRVVQLKRVLLYMFLCYWSTLLKQPPSNLCLWNVFLTLLMLHVCYHECFVALALTNDFPYLIHSLSLVFIVALKNSSISNALWNSQRVRVCLSFITLVCSLYKLCIFIHQQFETFVLRSQNHYLEIT